MAKKVFKTKKSRDSYERIRDTAIGLFARKGFRETSMRDISKANDMSLGALYYYFESKDEVVLAFYETLNEGVSAAFLERLGDFSDLPSAYEAFLEAKLEAMGPYRSFLHVIARELFDPKSSLNPLSSGARTTLTSSLSLLETMLDKTSDVAPEKARATARLLWFGQMGVWLFWLHDKSEDYAPTRKLIGTAATLLRWLPHARSIPGFDWIEGQFESTMSQLIDQRLTGE